MSMAVTVAPGLERRLRAELAGEVRFDRFTRGRYATDASHYQMMPIGVVTPRTMAEAERAIAIARAEKVTVLARGGGTSQSGQTVNHSLVIDCSKYLNRILDLDVAGRRCVVEPGIVLDDLNRQLKRHGLWFPVDISTASRATIGGMAGNNSCGARSLRYGVTRDNVLSIDAVLADGTAAHFGPIGPGLKDPAPDAKLRPLAEDLLAIGLARIRRDRGALSQSSAPGRRLQSRCARAQCAGAQPRPHPRRLGRHARLLDQDRAQAVAAARPPRGGRLPFRALLRRDGGGPAHRQAQADRGRARRPHHDRARPRHRHVPPDHRRLRARRAGRGAARRVRRGRLGREPRAPAPARSAHRRPRLRLEPHGREVGRRRRGARSQAAGVDHRGAHRRPQHHDVDEGRGKAGVLRRGLRGAARASRRIHRAAHRGVREERHPRHLVCPRLGRLPARAPRAQPAARQGQGGDARDRRGGVRVGARVQGLAFRRARRRAGALGIPRADVRRAAGARLRGGQGPLRSRRPVQSRQDRAGADIRRPRQFPLRPRLSRRADDARCSTGRPIPASAAVSRAPSRCATTTAPAVRSPAASCARPTGRRATRRMSRAAAPIRCASPSPASSAPTR